MMIQKATAMKIAIASIMLKGIIETSNYTLANAQSDSATMKEQEIDQKMCVADGQNVQTMLKIL
jgi:hypothetical protein